MGITWVAVTKYLPEYVDDVIRNIEELEETISGDWLLLVERYYLFTEKICKSRTAYFLFVINYR